MSEIGYNFDLPKHGKSIIKVVGVGGGGSNAVNHMFNQGIKDVEFVVCNTDMQALKTSPIPNKLQIGLNLTEGLGAGANPEKGQHAAVESKDEIRQLLEDDTRMVFITAGMGGGTGTGAAPVIAKIARDMDILTVGIVTVPFGFEGKKKNQLAWAGINELRENCDTVLVILNDKLREIYGNLSISEAFGQADNVLLTAAKGIAEIITVPGYVNVDFQDVRTVMMNAGAAVMGSATTEGENRARRAAEAAISSPLLNTRDIHGAKKILLSIISGEQAELQMDELTEITEYIQEMAGDDAEVIFGHGVDESLNNNLRVTVIATGFDMENEDIKKAEKRVEDSPKVFDLESDSQINMFESDSTTSQSIHQEPELIQNNESKDQNEDKEEEVEFDKGYFFESSIKMEDEGDNSLLDDEIHEKYTLEEEGDQELDEEGLLTKKEELIEQARMRREKLTELKNNDMSDDQLKEMLDVPAYQRKKVKLNNVPHSSERNISRFNLNDDNNILGNNRFLHDNVD